MKTRSLSMAAFALGIGFVSVACGLDGGSSRLDDTTVDPLHNCKGNSPKCQDASTAPTCTSFTYSDWSTCQNGTQTRTVLSSSPDGCTGGNPILSQSCTGTTDAGTSTDSGTTGGGTGITFNTCTNPTYTLAANPSNPQDGITLSGYYVDTDTWNFASYPGSQQTMYVCDYDDWYAMVNVNDNANDGAVKTYPNVHMDYGGLSVSSFTSISSVFAHTGPSSGAWDYAYDIWLNGYGTELMIWTQSSGRQAHVPGIPIVANVTIDGIAYAVHHSGGYTAYDMPTTMTSGTINVLHVMQDMISRGYLAGTAPLNSIQYGVEVCDTGGVDTRFAVNNFSVTAQ